MKRVTGALLFLIHTVLLGQIGTNTMLTEQKQHPVDASQEGTIINSPWEFRQMKSGEWMRATVPGTVHTDLLDNKKIEDPFYRTNERDLQWIDKENWEYKTYFNVSPTTLSKEKIELIFNGLDTYADVFLNGTKILSADNMFRTWTVNVKDILRKEKNELHVVLFSPIKKGLELYTKFDLPLPASNDQSENGGLGKKKVSIHTRKAGYHYGWDWGPRFVTSGIWRPIEIKAWSTAVIDDCYVVTSKIDDNVAKLEGQITVNALTKGSYRLVTKLNGDKVVEIEQKLSAGTNTIHTEFSIDNPKLWWPVGLGDAYLYTITQELFLEDVLVDSKEIKTGVRTIQLIQKKDADKKGASFNFQVNGVPVFAKGANYIPNDLFLPRVTLEDYEAVINSAVEANMNMLRVWGGGIYENDDFYRLCDEKGLLVWQDFMFACSMYPDTPEFLESIRKEAIDNVKRLRNHPSIALWCGNNEIEVAWSEYDHSKGWGTWRKQYPRKVQNRIWKTYETIFHDMLPEVVSTYTKGVDYWKSSPSAGHKKVATYETTSGDMHYWGVWHGKHPISDFNKYVARFMSEYGFQSFPMMASVKKYTIPSDWDIESEVMEAHQRSGIGNLRIKQYMKSHYKDPKNFESFLYVSQLLQAKAIKEAIEVHRMNMPYCMGTLFWQLNDCWPVASWSSMDYYKNWKAVQYMTKKAFNPMLVIPEIKEDLVEVHVVSDKLKATEATLELVLMDVEGTIIKSFAEQIIIEPNTSKKYASYQLKALLKGYDTSKLLIVTQVKVKDEVITENVNYFVEPKDLLLLKPRINKQLKADGNGNYTLELISENLVKNVYISIPGQTIKLSDNYVDLIPNKSKIIKVSAKNIEESDIVIKTLFDTY